MVRALRGNLLKFLIERREKDTEGVDEAPWVPLSHLWVQGARTGAHPELWGLWRGYHITNRFLQFLWEAPNPAGVRLVCAQALFAWGGSNNNNIKKSVQSPHPGVVFLKGEGVREGGSWAPPTLFLCCCHAGACPGAELHCGFQRGQTGS